MRHNNYNPFAPLISWVCVVGFIILLTAIISGFSQCSYNRKEMVEYSSSLESGDKAYTDIVSIEPKYAMTMETSKFVSYIYEVVCKCRDINGRTVWVCMSVSDYNEYIDPEAKLEKFYETDFDTVGFPKGLRILGKVCDTKDKDGLVIKIGSGTFLDFESVITEKQ